MGLTTMAAAVAAALLTIPGSAAAQQPPNIPTPPGAEVARFEMTITGQQVGHYDFRWTPPPSGCSRHAEGTLDEIWRYGRGKLVMEFMKFPGGHVVVQRHGRFADASFAAPGKLSRNSTGFFDFGGEPGCGGTVSLVSAACGKLFSVQSDLRFGWNGRKLSLERATTRLRKNPARDCGNPNGVLSFNQLQFPYPLVAKQRGALTKREIFGNKRGIQVRLEDKFLEPLEENPDVISNQSLKGHSAVTLKRLPN